MQIEWKLEQYVMDFERAMINSSHEAFPNVDVKYCWYHFVQALWRKIQSIELTIPYETDPLINSWFKQFLQLIKDIINS
ncbi:hypothetical protein I4U23_027533 [Adineta vaga]|nr:hypothetical protein I4U23_027533 [Adineta vaga]